MGTPRPRAVATAPPLHLKHEKTAFALCKFNEELCLPGKECLSGRLDPGATLLLVILSFPASESLCGRLDSSGQNLYVK